MANQNLSAAKTAKNDEFYTQYPDIQKEINAYIEYNPDVFKGKAILLPCDDLEWSNFTKFFAQNFAAFGLKKLISTSYAVESKTYKHYQPSLFETESPPFDANQQPRRERRGIKPSARIKLEQRGKSLPLPPMKTKTVQTRGASTN